MRRNDRAAPDVEVRSPARSFAQSLDTYYQPGRDRRGAEALQRGLSQLSGVFEQRAAEMRQERNQSEFDQGVADAMREEAGLELEGVKTGSIFRQHSKYYMQGLNEARGKAAAQKLRDELSLEYENWEGKNSDDPQAFRDWMNGQIGARMEALKANPDMLRGALPVFAEITNNMTAQHVARTNERLQKEQFEAFDATVNGVIDGYLKGDYDEDRMVTELINETDELYGMEGGVAKDQLVASVVNHAISRKDPSAVLALAKAHDSGKLKLSTASQRQLADAVDTIEADLESDANRRNAQAEDERKARETAILNDWTIALGEDPYQPLPAFKDVGDYRIYKAMEEMQGVMIEARTRKDPAVSNAQLAAFLIEYNAAETVAEKQAVVVSNFDNLTRADITKYMEDALTAADPTSAFNNQIISSYRSNFVKELGIQGTTEYDESTSSVMTTIGEKHFNDYILAKGADVDLKDPKAIKELTEEAKTYAYDMLVMEYPELTRDKANMAPDIASTTGLGAAIAADDAAKAQQAEEDAAKAAAEFEKINQTAGIATTPQTPEAPAVAPTVDEVINQFQPVTEALGINLAPPQQTAVDQMMQPAVPLEDQPPPFNDPDSDQPYDNVRAGFYGQLINRFTDGKDSRAPVRGSMRANEVLQEDPEFAQGVSRLATKYGVKPAALLAVMEFESGFDPSIENQAGSGATGIIQFMPSTARSLGTSVEALARMTRLEQLTYVEKYFDQFASRIQNGDIDDVYMAVLYPRAVGKDDGYVLFSAGTTAYSQNRGLDTNGDGTVTKFEAASKVRRLYYEN